MGRATQIANRTVARGISAAGRSAGKLARDTLHAGYRAGRGDPCPHCGARRVAGERFCPSCGRPAA